MDSNNWRAAQAQMQIPGQAMSSESVVSPGMEAGDWRSQLQSDSRQRIVNKIMETLKRHLPFSGQDGLQELKEIAVRFEENIYTTATSQSEYLRKISLKMLTMETKSQNPMTLQPNTASISKNLQDPAQGQMQIPGHAMNSESVVPPGMEAGDWRSQLQPDSRQRIVNKIMETLKRHLPFSGQEGLQELKEIAVRFEENIYNAATNQSEYLRKISLKMLTMETKSQNPTTLQPNTASNSKNLQDPAMSGEAVVQPEREAGGWRSELQPVSRLRIVNKIMETLKRHLPFSGEEGLLELKKIAVRFEEEIYCAATSRSEYFRNISLKMLKMGTKSQNPMDPIPLQPNDASNRENPQDSGGKNE